MKKLLVSLLICCALQSQAQVEFGAKAGLNMYHFTGPSVKDQGFDQNDRLKPGLVIGPYLVIPITEILAIQPSVLYSQEGITQKKESGKGSYYYNYINIPVVLQYKHESGFFAETGPQLSLFLNAKLKGDFYGTSTSAEPDKKFLKKTVYAWALGAGWEFPNGFGANLRGQFGLTSVTAFADNKISSSGFHLAVTYTFKQQGE